MDGRAWACLVGFVGVLASSCTSDPGPSPTTGTTAGGAGEGGAGAGGAGGVGAGGAGQGGSGGEATLSETAQSGARLKVRGFFTGDQVMPMALHDSELGVDCTAGRASDGSMRCLPNGASVVGGLGATPVLYADSECTVPVVALGASCDPTVFALESVGDACGTPHLEVYEVTTSVVSVGTVYEHAAGACEEAGIDPSALTLVSAVLRAPEDFVTLEAVDVPRGERLVARYVKGEDGSYFLTGTHDATLDVACTPGTLEGASSCLPESERTLNGFYADAACTVPVFDFQPPCDDAPRFARSVEHQPGCTTTVRFFETGPPIRALHFDDGACSLLEPVGYPSSFLREVGQELTSGAFAAISAPEIGSGRIALRAALVAEEPVARPTALVDTELGVDCVPVRFADGITRCAPPVTQQNPFLAAYEGRLYGDDQCTERVAISSVCAEHQVLVTDLPCGAVATTVLEIGAPFDGQEVYGWSGVSCDLITSSVALFEAEEVPFSTFAALSAVVLP